MTEENKNIIKVACIYATSVIGAGFASGQEIMQFFSGYKAGGFYGILLAGVIFSAVGVVVLETVYRQRIRNYEEFVFPIFGWIPGWILEVSVTVFMLCLYVIMVAGAGNVLSDRLGIGFGFSVLAVGIMCMVLISANVKRIVAISTVITPLLIAGIVIASLYIIFFSDIDVSLMSRFVSRVTGNWAASAILYVSYNSILAIVMMCNLLPYLKTERTARLGGILGGVLLCITALVVNAAIYMFYPRAYEKELPILSILKSFSGTAGNVYAAVLWLAMAVSAVNAGFCFTDRIATISKIDRRIIAVILCLGTIPLSMHGFSNLIGSIYPAFGYMGLFILLVVLAQGLKGNGTENRKDKVRKRKGLLKRIKGLRFSDARGMRLRVKKLKFLKHRRTKPPIRKLRF